MTKTVYMLIGLPYSGKTTFYNWNWKDNPIQRISSDDIVMKLCQKQGISYSEGFEKNIKTAQEIMIIKIQSCFNNDRSFVFDRTNLTKKSRKKWIDLFKKKGYNITGFVFKKELTDKELQRRREARPEQIISDEVYNKMKSQFEIPIKAEGFDELIFLS